MTLLRSPISPAGVPVASAADYLWLAKNVRGCLLFDPSSRPDDRLLDWLRRKHRYRCIGLTPALRQACQLRGKTIQTLLPPNQAIAQLLDALRDSSRMPYLAAEAVTLSCAYGCVLMVTAAALAMLKTAAVCQIRAATLPDEADLLRHIRIADYAVLDFVASQAAAVPAALGSAAAVRSLISQRAEQCRQDMARRFWRWLDRPGRQQHILGAYVDPLMTWRAAVRRLAALVGRFGAQLGPALGIAIALRIDAVSPGGQEAERAGAAGDCGGD